MFLLKKIIASFFMPLPIFFFLFGVGLYLLYSGRLKRGRQFLAVSVAWIALLSYAPFSALVLAPLENAYPKWQPGGEAPAYIHVLGYGHDSDARLPLSSQPHSPGLVRIVEGVIIMKQFSTARLVCSGYGDEDERSNAAVNADVAIALGVRPEAIILMEDARDTMEEASALKKIAGDEKVVLVTSASHMPRAMATFEKAGLNVTAAPTDFKFKRDEWLQWPSSTGLSRSEAAFHEYLGLLWMKLRHQ